MWPADACVLRISFRVHAPVGFGETVVLAGDTQSLGSWVPERGVALVTKPDVYPSWYTREPISLPVGITVTYKYLLNSGGCFDRWEPVQGVRSLRVRGPTMMQLDTFGSLRAQEKDAAGGITPTAGDVAPLDSSASAGAGVGPATSGSPILKHASTPHHHHHSRSASGGVPYEPGARPPSATGSRSIVSSGGSSSITDDMAYDAPSGSSVGTGGVGSTGGGGGAHSHDGSHSHGHGHGHRHGGAAGVVSVATPQRHSRKASRYNLKSNDRVIIAGYFLPVILHCSSKDGTWSAEWDYESLLSLKRGADRGKERAGAAAAAGGSSARASRRRARRAKVGPDIVWVGTPKFPGGVPKDQRPAVDRLLESMNCYAVWLEVDVARDHFDGFCLDTLWGVMHSIVDVYSDQPTRWSNKERQRRRWAAYTTVNREFAQKILEVYTEGALVWVHDYHLLLCPAFLARKVRATVGLFLHTPFPSSELFRTLSMRQDLLHGMLAASQIGFHLYEYARHFIRTCRGLLGVTNAGVKQGGRYEMVYAGRRVTITVSHVGIEPEMLMARLAKPEVASVTAAYRERFKGRIIMSAVDSLKHLRGIPLKLLAFDSLLEAHPTWRDRVVLYQLGTRHEETQKDVVDGIRELVDNINSKYGAGCCVFEERPEHPSLNERLGLWAATDVLVNTSLRAGLNLYPLEYVYVRRDPPGTLVISEFVGASRVLLGALRVNPWKRQELATALFTALSMDSVTRQERAEACYTYVVNNTGTMWGERILVDLKETRRDERGVMHDARMNKQVAPSLEHTAGFGFGFRVLGMGERFAQLTAETQEDAMGRAYSNANKRLIVLDYGGVLAEGEGRMHPSLTASLRKMRVMSREVRQALSQLARDPRNKVFIISGQRREILEREFAYLPEVGLAAENGFFYRWGNTLSSSLGGAGAGTAGLSVAVSSSMTDGGSSLGGSLRRPDPEADASPGSDDGSFRPRTKPALAETMYSTGADAVGLPLTASELAALPVSGASSPASSPPPPDAGATAAGDGTRVVSPRSLAAAAAGGGLTKSAASLGKPPTGSSSAGALSAVAGASTASARGRTNSSGSGSDALQSGAKSPIAASSSVGRSMGSTGQLSATSTTDRDRESGAMSDSGSVSSAWSASHRLGAAPFVWNSAFEHLDKGGATWKPLVKRIMQVYQLRTNGTFIQVKGASLVWYFGDADVEFGRLQAKELAEHLKEVLTHMDLEVQVGPHYVEVRPRGVNKGVMISRVVEKLGNDVDFVLCVGDDDSDELMFASLENLYARGKARAKKKAQGKAFDFDRDNVPGGGESSDEDSDDGEDGDSGIGGIRGSLAAQAARRVASGAGEGGGASGSGSGSGGDDGLERGRSGSASGRPPLAGARPRADTAGTEGASGGESEAPSATGSVPGAHDTAPILNVEPFTCTVGMKPSRARFYVEDKDQVLDVIRALAKRTAMANRSWSTTDLTRRAGGKRVGGGAVKSVTTTAMNKSKMGSASVLDLQSLALAAASNRATPRVLTNPRARRPSAPNVSSHAGLSSQFKSLTFDKYMHNIDEEEEEQFF